jgi:hypothetical protein
MAVPDAASNCPHCNRRSSCRSKPEEGRWPLVHLAAQSPVRAATLRLGPKCSGRAKGRFLRFPPWGPLPTQVIFPTGVLKLAERPCPCPAEAMSRSFGSHGPRSARHAEFPFRGQMNLPPGLAHRPFCDNFMHWPSPREAVARFVVAWSPPVRSVGCQVDEPVTEKMRILAPIGRASAFRARGDAGPRPPDDPG